MPILDYLSGAVTFLTLSIINIPEWLTLQKINFFAGASCGSISDIKF
jgi:hypothetical protein